MKLLTAALLLVLVSVANCGRILGLFPFPCRSHSILGSALLKELAARGHEVAMVSAYPLENPPKNYYDVQLDENAEMKQENIKLFSNPNKPFSERYLTALKSVNLLSEGALKSQNLQKFLESKPKFDVVLHMWALNEALLGIGHAVNASTIGFSVVGGSPFLSHLTANPTPYSYVPHIFLPYTDYMSFVERFINLISYAFTDFLLDWVNFPYQERILKQYFPDAPSLQELIDNIDITLINSHVATESPRPYLPNIIQIGGFHLYEEQNLPNDLKKFLDQSNNGVILFSLGLNVKSMDLPEDKLQAILNVFGKLKYNVLWKFEGELAVPKNVKLSKLLPQRAVLGHKNVKAFITHGGLGSTVEAVFHGVPMLCMPFFGDQDKNVADSVANGYAIRLGINDVTEDTFSKALQDIINDPKYKKNAMVRSDVYRNQEMNPMDKAVYWVEHVIKHKGAKHMKSRASNIPGYQYFMLDIIGFIFAGILITILILMGLLRAIRKKEDVSTTIIKKKIN